MCMTYACSLLSFSIVSIKAGDTRSNPVSYTHLLLSHRIEDELRRVLKRDIEVIAHIEPREDANDSRDKLIIIESEKLG